MPQFVPNPEAEANLAFDLVKPDVYRMSVTEITSFTSQNSGNECFRVRLAFVDPSGVSKPNGEPAKNPGTLLDNSLVHSDPSKQGKLRSFVEACGEHWGDITDTDVLVGKELSVKTKLEEWQGEQRVSVARYLTPDV